MNTSELARSKQGTQEAEEQTSEKHGAFREGCRLRGQVRGEARERCKEKQMPEQGEFVCHVQKQTLPSSI